jgi:hypothetical protein
LRRYTVRPQSSPEAETTCAAWAACSKL